jgi:hypothetical protein
MGLLREYIFLVFFITSQWAVIPIKLADHDFPV